MNSISLIEHSRSCLLIIDPQERLMPSIYEAERVIKQTSLMMRCASILEIPVLATTQYVKGLGPFVPELAELYEGKEYIDKMEFNAFANNSFREMLKTLDPNIGTLIITGVETHICVFQTAMGAMEAGFQPWIVTDAVSSRDPAHHTEALEMMRLAGAGAGPAEMIVYQLLERAGTASFKSILPYIR